MGPMRCDWRGEPAKRLFEVEITAGKVRDRVSTACTACSLHSPLVGDGLGFSSP